MQKPSFPDNEKQRIAALRTLQILDTAPEERFDRLTRLARVIFDVPIALISLVDTQRQWFKSRQGLDACETSREISFCGHAVHTDKIFYIPDTLEDPRFADNPLVTGAPNIRMYAGAPLATPEGCRIGTLCIIDDKPRDFSDNDLGPLRDLADCVEEELTRHTVRDAEQIIRDHESRLHAIVETVVDGIIVIDDKGRIQTTNPATETLFGYTAQEMIGNNVKMLMPEQYANEHDTFLWNFSETGRAKIIGTGREVTGRRRDGGTFPMELAVSEMNIHGKTMFTGVVRDISRQKRTEADLREGAERIRSIVDTVVDGIVTINAQGIIETLNPAAEKIFQYKASEVIGKNIKMLMPEPYRSEHDNYLSHYTKTGEARVIGIGREVIGQRKDGSTFPMDLAVSEMDISGVNMFTGIVRDITERKAVERLKSEFVSTVSHELRTPLTSIRGALGIVLGKEYEGITPKVRRLLETADRNSERLTHLINDILDLEKIESGNLKFYFEAIDLVRLSRTAVDTNEAYAQQHNVAIKLGTDVEHAMVRGDSHRLLQVFANFISNAVKYSPPHGQIDIGISQADNGYRVSIRDRGQGIPAEFRSRIFQRFAQVDSSDAREKGGTGLGLSITKAIIERLGGQVDYQSREGVGTVFYFDLPEWREEKAYDNKAVAKPGVLICEDDPDVAQLLVDLLEQESLTSDIAATAAGAKRLLAKNPYRLLLLDLILPDMYGIDLIRELRADQANNEMQIIVISGCAEEGKREFTGNAVSVIDWIQKPVDQERFRRATQQALRGNKRPRILHVENDLDIIQIARSILEDATDYTYASSITQAREYLNKHKVDLIILELTLPDGSGLELINEIKGHCPMVVFSGMEPGDELNQQVAAALTKSKTTNEKLLTTIRQLLHI